jgi:hypothetical protein
LNEYQNQYAYKNSVLKNSPRRCSMDQINAINEEQAINIAVQNRRFAAKRAMQISRHDRNFANDTNRQINNFDTARSMQIAGQDRIFANNTNIQILTQQYRQNGGIIHLGNVLTRQISFLV